MLNENPHSDDELKDAIAKYGHRALKHRNKIVDHLKNKGSGSGPFRSAEFDPVAKDYHKAHRNMKAWKTAQGMLQKRKGDSALKRALWSKSHHPKDGYEKEPGQKDAPWSKGYDHGKWRDAHPVKYTHPYKLKENSDFSDWAKTKFNDKKLRKKIRNTIGAATIAALPYNKQLVKPAADLVKIYAKVERVKRKYTKFKKPITSKNESHHLIHHAIHVAGDQSVHHNKVVRNKSKAKKAGEQLFGVKPKSLKDKIKAKIGLKEGDVIQFPKKKKEPPKEHYPQHKRRMYKCRACGNLEKIGTNHQGSVLHSCPKCSWKGMKYPGGDFDLPGHRIHDYVGELKENNK